jgi:alpha-ketoglutarate-dependent taurine dioxygenase
MEKECQLPLLVTPRHENAGLVEWIQDNKASFEEDLVRHGGILFRGFPVNTVQDFNDFMKCFNTEPLPYMFRSSPRQELDKNIKNIYRSTSYPNERSINMHNESSYSRVWGMKIVFCCIQPAAAGGETPLTDSRKVLQDISKDLVDKFREKKVKYRRNLSSGLGMPWQEVFQTTDKLEVEEICRRNDIAFEFRGDQLIIEWIKPAVYTHPVSGEPIWFNHILFFNKFSRYEEIDLSPSDSLPEEYLSSDTFFGDGTPIAYEEYLEIRNAFQKNKVVFPYERGDILFLDNMLVAHGRTPYQGERTIATAIIEAAYDAQYTL